MEVCKLSKKKHTLVIAIALTSRGKKGGGGHMMEQASMIRKPLNAHQNERNEQKIMLLSTGLELIM